MIRVLETLGRDFTIVFITGRWAMGQKKVEEFIDGILPNIKKRVFSVSVVIYIDHFYADFFKIILKLQNMSDQNHRMPHAYELFEHLPA